MKIFKEAEDLFEEMRKLHIQAERHFFDLFSPNKVLPSAEGRWQPLADVYETDEAWVIKVELAGVQKGDLSLSMNEGILTVKGVRRNEFEGRWRTYHQAEINYDGFERRFPLPERVLEGDIRAIYKDGLLTITIKKLSTPPPEKKRVTINISEE